MSYQLESTYSSTITSTVVGSIAFVAIPDFLLPSPATSHAVLDVHITRGPGYTFNPKCSGKGNPCEMPNPAKCRIFNSCNYTQELLLHNNHIDLYNKN